MTRVRFTRDELEMLNDMCAIASAAPWGDACRRMSARRTTSASRCHAEKRCFCGATGMMNVANRYFDRCRKAGVVILLVGR